jgi:hypothetical protein
MLLFYVIVLTLLAIASVLGLGWLLIAWRRERVWLQLVAERLLSEGRIEALTVQTLQAMRQAARGHFATRSRS